MRAALPRGSSQRSGRAELARLARLLVIGALAGVALQAQASEPGDPGALAPPAPCVTTVLDGALEEPPAPSPTRTTVPPPGRPTARELKRPITKREIDALIDLMTRVKQPDPRRPPPELIHPERLKVVLDDVTALVVALHASEARERLASARVRSKKARDWFSESYSLVESCVAGRFEGRGAEAYRQSLELVKNNRAALEQLMREFRKMPGRQPRPWRLPLPDSR